MIIRPYLTILKGKVYDFNLQKLNSLIIIVSNLIYVF